VTEIFAYGRRKEVSDIDNVLDQAHEQRSPEVKS
jgi:hypothetical protein